MISRFVEFLQDIVLEYGMFGLFAAEVIEEVIVPIPSSAVMMSAGFFFLGGEALNAGSVQELILEIAIPLSLGLTVGSLFVYGITFWLGRFSIEKWGRYLGVSWGDIERVQGYMGRGYRDEVLFILLRALPLVPSVAVNAFCGLTRMPIVKYVGLTLVGGFVRAVIMGFVGWQAGGVYFEYASVIDRVEDVVLAVIVAAFLGFVAYRIIKRPASETPVGKNGMIR